MFRYFVLGFISALVGIYHLSQPPWTSVTVGLFSLYLLLFVGALRFSMPRYSFFTKLNQIIIQLIFGALIAFLLSFYVENTSIKIPETAFNQKVWVEGEIVGLSTEKQTDFGQKKVQFTLKLSRINQQSLPPTWQIFSPRIRLSWYFDKTATSPTSLPKAGEKWRFYIKLKPDHFSLNPGAFDYETYLFQQHVQAVGYVLNAKTYATAQRLAAPSQVSLQQWIWQRLSPWFQQSAFGGVFGALLYGDKSQITAPQWQVFRQTGTVHLMAISGLHIGIMAAIGFWLFASIWKGLVLYLPLTALRQRISRTPRVIWGSLGASGFAFMYMALAGFAIPTVRAGLMVLILLIFVVFRRRFQVWTALALAAFFITLPDSRAVLSQGFWLSFIAVAIIYAVIASPGFQGRRTWQQFLLLQLALTLGMAPILTLFYGQVPTIGVVANLIAVPVVTLLALPLLMLSAVFILLFGTWLPGVAEFVMGVNNELWQWLWWGLNEILKLGQHTAVYWMPGIVSPVALIGLYVGLVIWVSAKWPTEFSFKGKILPWREAYRWLGAVLMIALFFLLSFGYSQFKNGLSPGEVKVTLLDVGQGQAMVIETRDHTLVYDTGPKFSDALDGASMALLPYLAHEKRNSVDLLVVSHSDMDHAGGTQTLLQNIEVDHAISGQPKKLNNRLQQTSIKMQFMPCFAGQSWTFDQVHFDVLSPQKGVVASDDNDASCVLRISTGKTAMMVMGDASKAIEHTLIEQARKPGNLALKSEVLIAGHHGSHTATSLAWLETIQPKLVLFSAGYFNRYHFPNKPVVERINKLGISMIDTACNGAITLKMTPNEFQVENRQRIDHKTWYHHQCKAP
ncbi:MAG: DNA internalization-related competence protein ComEC/Rec2 [Thiotrichales bacterium]|nr:DNA internalization-related competence protein ComEC/Rec2 [Thiotrichales bacterium]